MNLKTIIWISIALVLITGGAISYFKYFKPKMDAKKEARRKAEAEIVAAAQTPPAHTTDEEVNTRVRDYVVNTRPGFGGQMVAVEPEIGI